MARIVLNQAAVRLSGQTAGRLAVSKVVNEAFPLIRRMAPRSPAHMHGSGKPRTGPRLVEAIKQGPMLVRATEVSQRINSTSPVTMTAHEGSKRHRIPLRTGGKVLKFRWRQSVAVAGGRRRIRPANFSYFVHVTHPGNRKPVHFMTTPLASVARANGFLYRSSFVRSFS